MNDNLPRRSQPPNKKRLADISRVAAVELLPYTAAVVTLFAVWWVASGHLPSYIMPRLEVVLPRLMQNFATASYLHAVVQSLRRLMSGYAFALGLGLTVGLVGSIWVPFRLYARAMISILQSVPPIAWVPLLIIVFGFGDAPIMVVIAMSSLFPIALSVMDGTQLVNRKYIEAASVMGASSWQTVRTVYVPAVMPAFVTGAQVAFGNAWRSLIAAEMVGGVNQGLGWAITYAGEVADMAGVLAGIVTIGALAAIIDRVLLSNVKRHFMKAVGS